MKIDRRWLLAMTAGVTAASVIRSAAALTDADPIGGKWTTFPFHPLTRSLLDRTRRIGEYRGRSDPHAIERSIRARAAALGVAEAPAIKWIETPSQAFDHLSGLGLVALLDMETTGLSVTPSTK